MAQTSNPSGEQGLNPHQVGMARLILSAVAQAGQLSRGLKGGGANYVEPATEADQEKGLVCANCIFFHGDHCDAVEGAISPNGNCRYWVIPDELVNEPSAEINVAAIETQMEQEES